MSIVVIGGCPGTGKTSLAAALTQQSQDGVQRGVHLETDRFFNFLGHKIDPSTVEARNQNEVVLNAWCAAAVAYSKGGYEVYVDGVIGPWWLDQLRDRLSEFQYVMLTGALQTCNERVAARQGQASATAQIVTTMHKQFLRFEADYKAHMIRTDDKSIADVVEIYSKLDLAELTVK